MATNDNLGSAGGPMPLRARREGGGTPTLAEQGLPWGINSEYGMLKDVLLGPAETFRWMMAENAQYSALCRQSERDGLVFDKQVAMRQHREMVDAYEEAGVTVHQHPPMEELPYQIFARDSSFMTPWGAVITQLANPRRRGEYASSLRFYLDAGIPVYDMVSAGNFEGGDFNIIEPGAVLVGYTGLRGEKVAAEQIAKWVEAEGWEVHFAPIDGFYVHIDLMVCMLAPKLAAVCVDTTPDHIQDWLKSKGIRFIEVSFRDTMALGCNVVSLGGDRVLAPASSKDLIAKLRAEGFKVYDPDMGMIMAAGGGVHCMCQALRREAA